MTHPPLCNLYRTTNRSAATADATAAIVPKRLRAVFEQALGVDVPLGATAVRAAAGGGAAADSAAVVLLWRWYVRFELACGQPVRAKRVFFRAVAACPWAKALWLDAAGCLRRFLSPSEVEDIVTLVGNKGIHLRALATTSE